MPTPGLAASHHKKMARKKSLPREKEERHDCADVKGDHETCGDPIDAVISGLFFS